MGYSRMGTGTTLSQSVVMGQCPTTAAHTPVPVWGDTSSPLAVGPSTQNSLWPRHLWPLRWSGGQRVCQPPVLTMIPGATCQGLWETHTVSALVSLHNPNKTRIPGAKDLHGSKSMTAHTTHQAHCPWSQCHPRASWSLSPAAQPPRWDKQIQRDRSLPHNTAHTKGLGKTLVWGALPQLHSRSKEQGAQAGPWDQHMTPWLSNHAPKPCPLRPA